MQIEKAKEILLDGEKRKMYDQWRSGDFNTVMSFEQWMDMQARVHMVRIWNSVYEKWQALYSLTLYFFFIEHL